MRRVLSSLLPSPAMALAFVLLAAASAGLAAAATTATGPVIAACANKKSGALRLAGKCRRSERAVRWNQTGPRGQAGPGGASGPAGPAGAGGPIGPQGPGAMQITSSVTGPRTAFAIATVGPWTVLFECTVGAAVNILGPGHYYDTRVAGKPGISTPTETHIENGPMGEAGVTAGVGANEQTAADIELVSGATMYELRLQLTETGSGANNPCTVTGSATPAI